MDFKKYDLFEKLIDEGKYQDVIDLTKDSKDALDIFYYIIAEMAMMNFDDAIAYLEDNKKILEKANLPFLIDVHKNLLVAKNDVLGLIKAKDYYSELPYHSQEVEEKIKEFDIAVKDVESLIKQQNKTIDFETAKKYILSEDMDELYSSFKYFEDNPNKENIEFIKSMLTKHTKLFGRVSCAIFLGELGVDEEVPFLKKDGNIVTINPKKLMKYHSIKRIEKMIEKMSKYFDKNVSLIEISKNLLTIYEFKIYPDYIDLNDDAFFEAMSLVAKQYIGQEVSSSNYILDIAEEINFVLSSTD